MCDKEKEKFLVIENGKRNSIFSAIFLIVKKSMEIKLFFRNFLFCLKNFSFYHDTQIKFLTRRV